MDARNEFVREEKAITQLDRNLFIKGSIEDFNSLQAKKTANQQLINEIRTSAASKSQKVRNFVESLLSKEKSYINLTLLKDRLESANFKCELDGLFDREKLVADLKL